MRDKAKFRAIQLKDGSAWYVLYSPDEGPTEHIEDFYTEEDALEWIELESTSWLAKKRDAIRKARRSQRPATSPRKTCSANIHAHAHPVRRHPHVYGRPPAPLPPAQPSGPAHEQPHSVTC